jgi:tripartite-type tricarboxylate transporter receptor subunit TctC
MTSWPFSSRRRHGGIDSIKEIPSFALAVTSAARQPQLPDVPTMAESGVPDFVTAYWTGIVAPAGTPAPIIAKLNGAIVRGLNSKAIRDTLAQIGSQSHPSSPEDFANFIVAERRKWAGIAKTANISPE